MKIITNVTSETSRLIQLICFKKGVGWIVNSYTVQNLDKEVIVYRRNELGWDNARGKKELLEKWNYVEVSNEDFVLIVLGLKEAPEPCVDHTVGDYKVKVYPGKHIEVDGNKISNEDVETLIRSYRNT